MPDVKVSSDPHSARAATSTLRRAVEVVRSPWSLAGCSGCGLRDRARPAKSAPVYGGEPDGIGPFCGKDAVKIALWSVQSGSQQCVWKRSVTFQVAPQKPGIHIRKSVKKSTHRQDCEDPAGDLHMLGARSVKKAWKRWKKQVAHRIPGRFTCFARILRSHAQTRQTGAEPRGPHGLRNILDHPLPHIFPLERGLSGYRLRAIGRS